MLIVPVVADETPDPAPTPVMAPVNPAFLAALEEMENGNATYSAFPSPVDLSHLSGQDFSGAIARMVGQQEDVPPVLEVPPVSNEMTIGADQGQVFSLGDHVTWIWEQITQIPLFLPGYIHPANPSPEG